MKTEYLNEEKFQKSKKKISAVALIVLIIGLLIGGGLISIGIVNNQKIDFKYSEENRKNLVAELNEEAQKLKDRKNELEEQGMEYRAGADYDDEDYELKLITDVLNPGFAYYKFDEYKDNSVTSTYCSLKERLNDFDSDFDKRFAKHKNIPYFMFGGFIIVASGMISGFIFIFAKRREILAFTTQQVMPVAKEGMEKMAPTLGNVAKEITKGVKEGIKDEEQ